MPIKDKDRFGLYQGQVQTYTQFAATMAALSLFFTGVILTKYDTYSTSIRIPIAFLLISIFGFLYGALLYSNAAQEVSEYNEKGFRRAIFLGDLISEYLGVYLLVIAIPLVINIITDDIFLRIVTFLSSLIGLGIYQFSHFSILERHFGTIYRPISVVILLFGLLLFVGQFYNLYFTELSIGFTGFILLITVLASRRFHR